MSTRRLFATALVAALAIAPVLTAAQTPAAQTPATTAAPMVLAPADAKLLLGDWNISAESPMGPSAFLLTLKVADEKVVGEISSDMMAKTPVMDIKKSGTTIQLRYSFDYQGMAIPAAITLTPAGEGLTVVIDFADGAFTMNGTATKKKA